MIDPRNPYGDPTLGDEDGPAAAPSRTRRVLEDLLLLLAIVPVWPKLVLGWPGAIWAVILYLDVAFLVALLVVRWRRMRKALDRLGKTGDDDQALPDRPHRSRIITR